MIIMIHACSVWEFMAGTHPARRCTVTFSICTQLSTIHCTVGFTSNIYRNIGLFLQTRTMYTASKLTIRINSCRQLLKNSGILPFYSQYIFSLMLFVVRNMHLYTTNQETHGVNPRHNTDLHFTTVRLTAFKEEALLEWGYLTIFPEI
jgi:hypothetical protein